MVGSKPECRPLAGGNPTPNTGMTRDKNPNLLRLLNIAKAMRQRALSATLLRGIGLAVAVVVLTGLAPAGAFAAAGDTETHDVIELRTTFSVPSNSTVRDQYIPIPDGLTPTEVRGTLIPDAAVDGRVLVVSHGRTIATFALPTGTAELDIAFPVDASDVDQNGFLVFGLRFLTDAVTDDELICVVSNFGTVQMLDVSVAVTGTEAPPSTIAQFFSPSVREVSVIIPENPESAVQEAGLAAVAALAHRYPTLETEITLSTAEHDERAADVNAIGGRLIEIVPGEGDVVARIGLSDGIRKLTLAGDPAKLTAAANALGSPELAAVEAVETTALSKTGHQEPRSVLTLEELGTQAVNLNGIGTSIVEVPIDQSDFSSPVSSFQLHLVGIRSQVPEYIAAMLSVYWNRELISSQVFDENTAIDLTIDIASTRVLRNNVVSFRLDALPNGAGESAPDGSANAGVACGGPLGILPIEVFIDGKASTVTATPGQSLGAGFVRFPQMLANVLPVAIGTTALLSDSISDAGLIVCALQRASSYQFSVSLLSSEDFLASSATGLIVGASAEEIDALGAPLRMGEFRQISSSGGEFVAGVRSPYAALQAFNSGGREVLSLSSWGPYQPGSLVGRMLQSGIAEYVATEPSGWYGLFDDILIAQSTEGAPVFIDSRSVALQPERAADFNPTLVWVAIGVATLLVLFLLGLLARAHVRRRARRFVAAEAQWNRSPHHREPSDGGGA